MAIPAVVLVLFFVDFSIKWTFDASDKEMLRLLANVVFLNSLHVIFTFYLVCYTPVYRKAAIRNSGFGGFVVLFFVFLILLSLRSLEAYGADYYQLSAIFLLKAYTIHHVVRQALGISLIYNRKAVREKKLSAKQKKDLRLAEKKERRNANLLIGLASTYFLVQLLFQINKWILPNFIRAHFVLAAIILIVPTLYSYFKISRIFLNKVFFLFRLSLIVAMFFSFVAVIGLNIVHGIEYFLVYRRVNSHAKLEQIKNSPPIYLKILVFLIALIVIIGAYVNGKVALGLSEPFKVFFSLGLSTLVALHYYLDRIIFSMSNPEIGRLTKKWMLYDKVELEPN